MENSANSNRFTLSVKCEKNDKRNVSTMNAVLCESFDAIATISGYVNKDTEQKALEPLDGVDVCITKTVDITKCVATTTTNSKGYYEFKNIPAGSYLVIIDNPDLKISRSGI